MNTAVATQYAVFHDFNKHTAIRVHIGRKYTEFVPMDSAGLRLARLLHDQFQSEYKQFDYPLGSAVEKFLSAAKKFGATKGAAEHLKHLNNVVTSITQENTMQNVPATAGKPVSEAPALAAALAAMNAADAKMKKADKEAAATKKTSAKKNAPKKAAAKPAKKAAKAKPAKKAKTAKKAATAKPEWATKKKGAKAAKKNGGASTRLDPDQKFKVKDGEKAKRGVLLKFVDDAKSLKTFTRESLAKKFGRKDTPEHVSRHFLYCLRNGIFAKA